MRLVPADSEQLWQCVNASCGAVLREADLQRTQRDRFEVLQCPRCGDRVLIVKTETATAGPEGATGNFFASVAGALVYPFRGRGIFILIAGTLALCGVRFAAPFALWMGLFVMLFAYGYLSAYLFDIVLTTANNEDDPPDFPEFANLWDDIARPFLFVLATMVCSFGPLWGYVLRGAPQLPVVLALAGWGLVYFPMALLAIVMSDSLSGLNPVAVFVSIARVPGPYIVVCVFLLIVFAAQTLLHGLLIATLPAWLAYLVVQLLSLYGSMTSMRLLGVLYRTQSDRLNWF